MATWVIEHILARSSRPGFHSKNVQVDEVDAWLKEIKEMRIKSIICLLTNEQLLHYAAIPEGLLEYYRKEGFEAKHFPITDPHEDPIHGEEELIANSEAIYQIFLKLPKPVLVHCNAGLWRTGHMVEYIRKRWSESGFPIAGHIS